MQKRPTVLRKLLFAQPDCPLQRQMTNHRAPPLRPPLTASRSLFKRTIHRDRGGFFCLQKSPCPAQPAPRSLTVPSDAPPKVLDARVPSCL
ncbi:hypothetical protein PWT90_08633 [Aphanocladium album]|nr:hypothetical protein PWT90_08633 [Aphanocladium album]